MRKISKVNVLPDYRLQLTFDDDVSGSVDLSGLDRIDLCPDALYLRVTGKNPEDVFPALRRESTLA
ncbi:MAG: hypothetical protein HYR98_07860 [Nitrospirae bacterium]|nr:hypothetical protein [Nitrospirota bacterium]